MSKLEELKKELARAYEYLAECEEEVDTHGYDVMWSMSYAADRSRMGDKIEEIKGQIRLLEEQGEVE